jgi:hypothetical protein
MMRRFTNLMIKNPIVVALDFDETYTAAPHVWQAFVQLALTNNMRVTIVTARHASGNNSDVEHAATKMNIPVIYTGGRQKKHVFDADIWIDDAPESIANFNSLVTAHDKCVEHGDFT